MEVTVTIQGLDALGSMLFWGCFVIAVAIGINGAIR